MASIYLLDGYQIVYNSLKLYIGAMTLIKLYGIQKA